MSAPEAHAAENAGVVGLISRLAHSGLPAEEFYTRFLDALPTPPGTLGTVAWVCGDDSFSKIAAGTRSHNESVQLPVSAAEHAAQLDQTRRARVAQYFEPPTPSGYQIVVENALPHIAIFPIIVDQTVPVVVEAYLPPDLADATTRLFLRQAELLCEIASNFHRSTSVMPHSGHATNLGLSPTVHQSLRVHDTCYAIVNEGRRAIGCDRVTVLVRHGDKYRAQSVSGQDTINPRANLIQFLQRLVNRVMRTGEEFWYPESATQLPPEIEHELEAYLEVSLARRVGIVPLLVAYDEKEKVDDAHALRRREHAVGALVVEQFTDLIDTSHSIRERTAMVASEGSVALRNATDYENIFLLPLWRWVGDLRRYFRGSLLPKTAAGLAAIALAILAMIFVPAELKVASDGRLMPELRRNVFAALDGTVDELNVEHGSQVVPGDLLATIRNPDLELAIQQNRGDIRKAQSQLHAIAATRFTSDTSTTEEKDIYAAAAEEENLKAVLDSLLQQQRILQHRKSLLSVESPIEGQVITWNLDERLRDRPVQRGQRLLEIANFDGPWCLELSLPDRRVADVIYAAEQSDQPVAVTFLLASDNSQKYVGSVREIAKSTRVDPENGQNVLVRVAINKEEIPFLQPGTQIQAKIHCGRRPLGYVWLRDVWYFLKSNVWFRVT